MKKVLHDNWGGVLIMGGQGQRMGGVDKSSLKYKGQSFRDVVLSHLSHNFHNVAVSTGPQSNPNINYTQFKDIDVNGDFIGPAGGLLAALDWAKHMGLEGIVTLPVDTPILPENICERLCASGQPCFAQHANESHWLHAAWPVSEISALSTHILEKQTYSLRGLHRAIRSIPVIFETPRKEDFKNINTLQDLESLEALN